MPSLPRIAGRKETEPYEPQAGKRVGSNREEGSAGRKATCHWGETSTERSWEGKVQYSIRGEVHGEGFLTQVPHKPLHQFKNNFLLELLKGDNSSFLGRTSRKKIEGSISFQPSNSD